MTNLLPPMLSFRVALVLAFLSVAGAAMADPEDDMQPYIEEWLGEFIDSQSQSLAGTPGAGSSEVDYARDLLKDFIKGNIKDHLLDGVFGQTPTLAMEEILQSARKTTNYLARRQTGSKEERAALNVASDGLNVYRVLPGMAKVGVEVFMSAADVRKGVQSVMEGKVNDALMAAAEKLAEDRFSGSALEFYSKSSTAGGCTVSVNVIWQKTSDKFQFLVLGDCGCQIKPVPDTVGTLGPVRLAQWSVRGRGTARWVGAEEDKRRSSGLVPKSTIRGDPEVRGVTSNAARYRGGELVFAGTHPYSDPRPSAQAAPSPFPKETDRQTSAASPADNTQQRRQTVQEGLDRNRSGFSLLDGAIPDIPDEPLSEEQKARLLARSVDALRRIEDRKMLAEQNLEALEERRDSGNPPTAKELKSAREAISDLEALERRAVEALNKIGGLIEPSSDDDEDGSDIIFASPESQVALSDRRAAIEDFRPIAACRI